MDSRPCPNCHCTKSHIKFKVDGFVIVTCHECGFVYLANPINLDNEQQNYEEYFKTAHLGDYTQESSDKNIRQAWAINETRLTWIKNHVHSGRLLDIGCGRGFFLHHAQKHGFSVEGVELSRLAARYASEHFDLTIQIGNIDDDMTIDGEFDVITMWHVLEHFQNPRAALTAAYQTLSEKGRLFIEVPNLNSLKFQLSPTNKKWRGGNHPTYHRSFFNRDSLHDLCKKAGFVHTEDAHIIYQTDSPGGFFVAKKMLNSVFKDSFLNVAAAK